MNFFERFSKARSVLVSAVFCEIIVTIKVSNGSFFGLTNLGVARLFFKVCKTVMALVSTVTVVFAPFYKMLRKYYKGIKNRMH